MVGNGSVHGTPLETNMETPLGSNGPARGHAEGSKQTQFQPGHPGSKKGGGRKPRQSVLLRDMLKVYRQDEALDRTDGQRALRQMLKKSPTAFIRELADLEKAQLAAAPPQKEESHNGAELAKQPSGPAAPVPALPEGAPNLCTGCRRRLRVGQPPLSDCFECFRLNPGLKDAKCPLCGIGPWAGMDVPGEGELEQE